MTAAADRAGRGWRPYKSRRTIADEIEADRIAREVAQAKLKFIKDVLLPKAKREQRGDDAS
jgi:hypothetical protein